MRNIYIQKTRRTEAAELHIYICTYLRKLKQHIWAQVKDCKNCMVLRRCYILSRADMFFFFKRRQMKSWKLRYLLPRWKQMVFFWEKREMLITHLCPQNLFNHGVQCCVTPSWQIHKSLQGYWKLLRKRMYHIRMMDWKPLSSQPKEIWDR